MSIAEYSSQCQEQSKYQLNLVLEFSDLSSSSSTSSVSLKVSMGKREYKTWDKGDFKFPLTTFRDDLVVMLQDDHGNEISHAGFKTSSIVEKGSWDDTFHLEGGGYVQMKLQFILSEDERIRIRNVRESAMRKKQEHQPSDNRTKGTLSSSGSNQRLIETQSKRNIKFPETTSGSQRKNCEKSSETEGHVFSEKISSQPETRLKRNIDLPRLIADEESEKTSSNVRKMISAFETGLSQERSRPLAKTQASKSQPNIVGMSGSLKDQTRANTEKMRIKSSYSHKNLESLATTVGEHSVCTNDSPGIDIQRASNAKLKSITFCRNEQYDCESSGAWIFPDNMKNLCVTTASKEVLSFLEDNSAEFDGHQSINKRMSMQEKVDPMIKDKERPHKPNELPAEGSTRNGSSGPFGQVFKIAMTIGFGIFVLLNRQKETRTVETRSKESKFTNAPDYMDQLSSLEDQWKTLMEKED